MNDYQKNILNTEMFYRGTAVSNIGGILNLSVEISYEDASLILNEMIQKTPSLRLRLSEDRDLYEEKYQEYILKRVFIHGEYQEALSYAEKNMKVPFFSLYDENLFVVEYIEYNSGCMLFLKLHHLLGDAATIALICTKFEQGYYAISKGIDYICCDTPLKYDVLSSNNQENAFRYFADKLTSVVETRISDKESRECNAERLFFSVPLYKEGMTAYFVAAIYVYASIVMNSSKVAMGFVLGNRRKTEKEMVGMFANTLPLVLEFENGSFEELSKVVGNEIFGLMKYSKYSLELLKKYNNIKNNVFDISVSYRYKKYLPKVSIGDVVECFNGCVDTPIRISAEEVDNRLDFSITYKKSVFCDKFIENMGNAIISILNQGLDNKKVADIDILTDYDKEVYRCLNSTDKKHMYEDVIECFKKNITESEVVVWNGGSINGYELEHRSRKIAAYIQKENVCRIGIKMNRSHEMIEVVLGVLMAGAAFMIISDVIPGMEKYCDIILEKESIASIYDMEYEFVDIEYDSDSTAYMVCTSGTTGKQKCIEISRKSLMSRLEWVDSKYGLRGSILQKTVNTFDVSVWEMMSVIFGARLCLLNDGDEKLPSKIASAMLEFGIEKVHFVPSILRRFLKYVKLNDIVFPALKEVYVSGEKLERVLADEFFEVMNDKRLINLYGPAECTIDVTFFECKYGEIPDDVPIGHPVDNTKIYIMNDDNRCMPVGVAGEICVMGELVGKGYIESDNVDASEKIKENHIKKSKNNCGYCRIDGESAYKTGDIGKIDYDGNIYIYGRKDNQVKLRGMRVDLSEVKNIILKCENIVDAEVIKCNNRLECYYSGDADVDLIKNEILKKTYAYAVPSIFKKVDSLPLTESGKVDVKLLKRMSEEKASIEAEVEECENELSEIEKEMLREVRQYVNARIDDNLFDVGLDSVSVLDIVCNFQEKGYDIDFSDFYENLTIRRIAANIENKRYYTFLKSNESEDVMICFPYAGGEPNNFANIAKMLSCDVIGVYMSSFSALMTIEETVEILKNVLPLQKYKSIYVYGQCVGSVVALEFASAISEKLKGIILVTPTIRSSKNSVFPSISIWKLIPDIIVSYILQIAGGTGIYTKAVIRKFRKDTDRYFEYEPHKYENINDDCNVSLIFGTADIFTKNMKKIIKQFQKYIPVPLKTYNIDQGKHFISETNYKEIHKIIEKEYPKLKSDSIDKC